MPIALGKDEQGNPIAYSLDAGGAWQPTKLARTKDNKTLALDTLTNRWVDTKLQPSMQPMDIAKAGARSYAQGLTGGWADEIEAAARGKSQGEMHQTYENIPAGIRVPGEMTGALTTGAASSVLGAASRIPQALRAVTAGPIMGAFQGAGNAPEGQRGPGAMMGAGLGLLTGATMPPLMGLASRVTNPALNAATDIGRGLRRDAMTPQQIEQALNEVRKIRPDAVPADVGGENTRGILERIANRPGEGRSTITGFIEPRQKAQADRLAKDLKDFTGTTQSAVTLRDDLIEQRKTAGKPL